MTLQGMFEGLRASLQQYKGWVEAEEAAIAAGPVAHQRFLEVCRDPCALAAHSLPCHRAL